MLAEHDPLAVARLDRFKHIQMPNLRLGDGDADAVLAYLEAQSAKLQGTDWRDTLSQHSDGDSASTHERHNHEEGKMD